MRSFATTVMMIAILSHPIAASAQVPTGKTFAQLISQGFEVKTALGGTTAIVILQKQTSVFLCVATFQAALASDAAQLGATQCSPAAGG
jgi:hypothetical protein